MLSYLHSYHAGNAADVLKHSVLVFCINYLKKKAKPLLCVDTHAGSGFYDLSDTARIPNREWEKGIGRLREAAGDMPFMIADYVKLSEKYLSEKHRYAGSSVLMARELTGGDRLVCYELHPREFEALKVSMEKSTARPHQGRGSPPEVPGESGGRPTVELRRENGLGGFKALLPPPSRRGLVFIDPSWEEQSEYESVPGSVREGLKRFAEGIFIIWYPLLARPKLKEQGVSLRDTLYELSDGKRCRVELFAEAADPFPGTESSPRGMYGSGFVIYNPPWTLRAALEEALPWLALTLYNNGGGWHLDWDA